jgi:hypothetical protein
MMQRLYRTLRKIPFMPSEERYNVTISHERKFIWFRVAKVGTRTILNHLKECEVHLDVHHGSWLHYPVNSFDGYFKFAFVRNPWERLASCWRNKVIDRNYFHFDDSEHEKMKTFENFVGYVSDLDIDGCDRHLRSQSVLIDLNAIDYLGRMETFGEDANCIFRRLGLPEKDILRKNKSSSEQNYQEYYTERLIEKVAQIYQRDIQIFGYSL